MALKAPTPSRSTPTPSISRPAAYAASLEAAAKQHSHVDELIVKNRTLEHTVERLKSALHSEEIRSKEAMQKVQHKWETEREEWREGCDALQTAHRIAHLKTVVELDKEKLEVLKEKDRERKERLKRLQRDFKLTMFQIQDSARERRVHELERELEQARRSHRSELQGVKRELEGQASKLNKRTTEVEERLVETSDETRALQVEKTQLETTLAGLRSTHATLLASATSKSKELERATLRAEVLETSHGSLKKEHEELQKKYSDSTRQLEKWTNIEKRDQAELEELREQKINLEITVKALENAVSDAKKTSSENVQAKLDKWKKAVQEYRASLEEANANATQYEADAEQSRVDLDIANKELKKIRKQLEAKMAKSKTSTAALHRSTPLSPIPDSNSEAVEPLVLEPERPKPRSKGKPPSRTGRRAQSKDQHGDPEEATPEIQIIASPPGHKAKSKRPADDDSDVVEEVLPATAQSRSRKQPPPTESAEPGPSDPKPQSKRGRQKKSPEAITDVQDVQMLASPFKKGKAKAPQIVVEDAKDEEKVAEEVAKRKRKKSNDEEADSGRKSVVAAAKTKKGRPPKVKPPSRQPSATRAVSRSDGSDAGTSAITQPKKKRKINLFPAAQPQTFDWGNLTQGGGGLNIPTDLSPVKDSDLIPPRSSSRLGSTFGSFSHAGRR